MAKSKCKYQHAWYAVAVTRLALAFVFLWAFFDKTFGLGYATTAEKAWTNGGSPTTGFLMGTSQGTGPFAEFFGNLAGQAWVDWLFMVGLLGIGLALLLGIGLRLAAFAGSLLLVFMWAAILPLENNPIVDDHIVYALVLWIIALSPRKISLVNAWLGNSFVKKNSWLW